MVKVFALIPRRPDVTDEFFHQHWAGPHAEVSKRITTLLRYVQSHRIGPDVAGLAAAPYEGIAEVWFTDFATAAGMGEDPNYVEGAHADEPNFIDLDNLAFVICDEEVVRSGPPIGQADDGAKAMLLLRRAAGTGPGELAQTLGTAGQAMAGDVPSARRVTVSTAVAELYADGGEPPFDAIVELWFDDAEAFSAAWGPGTTVLGRLGEAIDPAGSLAFLGDELRVIWPEDVAAASA